MYILFVMPQLNMGGAERVIVNILNHLNRERFKVELLLFDGDGSLVDDLAEDITLHSLGVSSVAKGMPQLLKRVYELKPDIVFSGMGNLNLYLSLSIPSMRLLLPKTRWIARQASILSLNNSQERSPQLYNFLYKRVYRNYDLIICQSKYMQRDLVENYNFPVGKSVIINNPVDIEGVYTSSLQAVKYPFGGDKIRLITVGGLRYEKRQDLLLQAFAKLDSQYVLTIIGDGVKRRELESLASTLGVSERVVFLGYRKDLHSYIGASDIFLLTSEYEGFPNVVLEANACGVGVVAFNSIGGISEIIENGVNGFLVPYGDIDGLANRVKMVERGHFNSEQIREITTKRYSIDLIIKKYEDILKG